MALRVVLSFDDPDKARAAQEVQAFTWRMVELGLRPVLSMSFPEFSEAAAMTETPPVVEAASDASAEELVADEFSSDFVPPPEGSTMHIDLGLEGDGEKVFALVSELQAKADVLGITVSLDGQRVETGSAAKTKDNADDPFAQIDDPFGALLGRIKGVFESEEDGPADFNELDFAKFGEEITGIIDESASAITDWLSKRFNL